VTRRHSEPMPLSDPGAPAMGSVFCIEAVVAQAPFRDGSRVELRELGCYTSLEAASAWIRGSGFRKSFDANAEVERLLFVQGVERLLDMGHRDRLAYVTISPAGDVLERVSIYEDFLGRHPSSCRWQRGDIAGCVYQGCYRIGVVLALPLSVDWLHAQSGPGTSARDDVYLIGLPGDADEHHHAHEATMFEPLAEVPEELRRRLAERSSKYPVIR
jgi:hypothetical protein